LPENKIEIFKLFVCYLCGHLQLAEILRRKFEGSNAGKAAESLRVLR